ncbi:hypothetical protein DL96DRAFT_1704810 [Flagelloscypha sp. PMI_526]|nr:hypothetical protein DL96DRAFT_1704810 [Flagelloscypha sp. PMI_526]
MPSLFRRRSFAFLRPPKVDRPDEPVPPLPPPKDSERLTVSTSDASKSSLSLSRKASRSGGAIMRRMSTILKPKDSVRTKKVSTTSLYGPPVAHVVPKTKKSKKDKKNETQDVFSADNSEDETDSIDEIRRPSGLGDSVSIHSQKSFPPASPYNEKDDPFSLGDPQKTKLSRNASTPNLAAASHKWRGEINIPGLVFPPSQTSLSKPHAIQKSLPELPVEVLCSILSYLSRGALPELARVSRAYRMAARNVLYRNVDLETVAPSMVYSLVSTLAAVSDIADAVRTFHCLHWPASWMDVDHRLSSPARNLLGTALERMGYLTSMSLPDFDLELLQHHSAFGLTHLVFYMRHLSERSRTSLFSWLDGQINITSLMFPNLQDEPEQAQSTRDSPLAHFRSMTSPDLSTDILQPPTFPSFLTPNPSPNVTPVSTPMSTTFPTMPLVGPGTLLPELHFLHAPTHFGELLVPSRPVEHVFLNVDLTLYSGLRPGKLMQSLRGIQRLTLRFGEQVDRRTVEKMLGAVGSYLGTASNDFAALHELEVQVYFSDPGSEDVLYKIIHTILPRYTALHKITLRRIGGSMSPSPRLGSPSRSCSTPSTPQKSTRHSEDLLTPLHSPAPSTPNRRLSLKSPRKMSFQDSGPVTPPLPSPFRDYHEALTEHDQLHVNLWLKQAPTLTSITLLSSAVWILGQDNE